MHDHSDRHTVYTHRLDHGTIDMQGLPRPHYMKPARFGSVEIDTSVGPHETIQLGIGELILDRPTEFLGSVVLNTPYVGLKGQTPGVTADPEKEVILKGIVANSYAMKGDVLTFYEGGMAVDSIRLPGMTAATIGTGWWTVTQTALGVQLGGMFGVPQLHLAGQGPDVMTLKGTTLTINAPIGRGTIDMEAHFATHDDTYGTPSTLNLNAAVGPRETIKVDEGHLTLNDVWAFQGTIDMTTARGHPIRPQ